MPLKTGIPVLQGGEDVKTTPLKKALGGLRLKGSLSVSTPPTTV